MRPTREDSESPAGAALSPASAPASETANETASRRREPAEPGKSGGRKSNVAAVLGPPGTNAPGSPESSPARSSRPFLPPAPPPPPPTDLLLTREMQEWVAVLEAQRRTLWWQNRLLVVVLACGSLFLLAAVVLVYRATVGSYAVLDGVSITPHPANPGLVNLTYRVTAPGRVHCRRTSGGIRTELIDSYSRPGTMTRPWTWPYRPGEAIEVTLWDRGWFSPRRHSVTVSTSRKADIAILIDTTESMNRSIAQLKEQCVAFSEQLARQAIEPRFALLAFGDRQEKAWFERHSFTTDVAAFRGWVAKIARFEGGDLPESSLDALELAAGLPLDEQALRWFYLVTDAPFHEPSRAGRSAEQVRELLEEHRIVLQVFSRSQYEADYQRVLPSDVGKFRSLEAFGRVLSQGRVLED